MIRGIQTLDDIDVRGKRVLVRLDINSDIRSGRVMPSERLTAPLETIRELVKKKARVVIMAHQGRPGSSDFTSLRLHAKALAKYIPITFVPDTIGKKAVYTIARMTAGQVVLLENVRMLPEEFKPSPTSKMVSQLAPLFDYYINDAFSASHRAQTSIVSFPERLESCIGRVMQRELESIQKIKVKDALFVLGGSKPADVSLLLEKRSNKVLASGLFGPFCLMAKGYNVGKQNELMKKELREWKPLIQKSMKRITTPVDLAVEEKGKRIDLDLDDLPTKYEIVDLGKKTILDYAERIKEAKAVFFKGLVGLCHTEAFSLGTKTLLKAVEQSKGFTVVSGGHTVTAIDRFHINRKKIGYVSLSGGALVHYLAGVKLPGLEALARGTR